MASNNPFSDWTRMFGEFRTPTMDMNQLISQYRRNAETGTTVIQILTESGQAIARRNTDLMRANAEQALKASKEMMSQPSSPNASAAASKQADFAKNWLEHNVNSMREIAEMSTKSIQEAFDVISKRAAEQMKEFSDVAANTSSQMKKKAA